MRRPLDARLRPVAVALGVSLLLAGAALGSSVVVEDLGPERVAVGQGVAEATELDVKDYALATNAGNVTKVDVTIRNPTTAAVAFEVDVGFVDRGATVYSQTSAETTVDGNTALQITITLDREVPYADFNRVEVLVRETV